MKNTLFILLLAMALAGCTKKYTTTNNYYTNPPDTHPAFVINGIQNISFVNDDIILATLFISVEYEDSAQENVTLSVAGLPPGIAMDTTWVHRGIPTFGTRLMLYDTTDEGAQPGKYQLTLLASTASGKLKSYPFTLDVHPIPATYSGSYTSCTSSCSGPYTDSIYADPAVPNKIWFSNFGNSGNQLYGVFNDSSILRIPAQTAGGVTYSGVYGVRLDFFNRVLNITYRAGTEICTMTMQ